MKELKVGERIILEVTETTYIACEHCFFAKEGYACPDNCSSTERSDHKNVIFKEVRAQRRDMKKNKHSLKISRSCFGDITLDGYSIATYSNDELKILKNLLPKVLCEVNEYIKE